MGAAAQGIGPDGPFAPGRRTATLPPMANVTTEQLILLLVPILLIQLGLMIVGLIDLEREERRVKGGSKLAWALIIVFVNIIGPILYFTVGREET
jgi:Phospholipase_D-nuclease N-terminal